MKLSFDFDVTCVILGGGRGARLSPLTTDRAKPAVPLGTKYRLIDIPISNCINSGLKRIYVLTQFNSKSLHQHIQSSYHFDRFTRGFIEVLAAQQTPLYTVGDSWYSGTADAVAKNIGRLRERRSDEILILSGDQIYKMDFQEVLMTHRSGETGSRADVTIAALLVDRQRVGQLGVMEITETGRVKRFVEKPGDDEELLESLEAPRALVERHGLRNEDGPWYLANMGIYVFQSEVLENALASGEEDFGKHILPSLLDGSEVRAHLFSGYWEDIGTVRAFLEANLNLATNVPDFNFYDPENPIYTRARLLPATKIQDASIRTSLIAEGSLVSNAEIDRCLLGVRSVIGSGVKLRSSYIMGNDTYETDVSSRGASVRQGLPPLGIGDDSVIENTIVDKNTRIGRNVEIRNIEAREEYDDEYVSIREGICVVPRNGVVPDGYRI